MLSSVIVCVISGLTDYTPAFFRDGRMRTFGHYHRVRVPPERGAARETPPQANRTGMSA